MENRNLQGSENEKWVHDSSVDHKGHVPVRASTGVWKASFFVFAIEFTERLTYFGISTNLIIYLTQVIHQDLKTAAENVNYWSGATTLMPLLGAFLADAYFGRFSMILFSSVIYLVGLSLLTMSEVIPSLKPCDPDSCDTPNKLHEVIFFIALYLISIGTGGHKPCLESFGADQFDDNHAEERKMKTSFFNLWNIGISLGLVLGVTVIVYVQDKVSWAVADTVLLCVMAISFIVFIMGKPVFRYQVPEGSPLTPMLQVLVAAIAKRNLPHPSDPGLLYEVPMSTNSKGRQLCHTNKLSFLDKAAILEEDGEDGSKKRKNRPWRLATVTKVEELKLLLNMVPIWLSTLAFGLCVAQTSTFFVKQSTVMDRKIGTSFELRPASIYSITAITLLIAVTIYDRLLVPILRKYTGNERGITILQRIGFGMVFSVLTMITAALVERRRQRVEVSSSMPMSVLWLVPQFIIIGIGDAFTLIGLQEYFYDQAPDSMRSLGIAFYLSVLGASSFLSSFLITLIDRWTSSGGKKSWFGKDLNHSRLDKLYWLVAAITGVNLCAYMFIAKRYSYKNVQRNVGAVDGSSKRDEVEMVP